MRLHLHARTFIGGALFAVTALVAAHSLAAPNDYRFELVQAQPAGPGKTAVTVRLVHVPDKKPVAGAVLFETKTDMAPGGMAEMPSWSSVIYGNASEALRGRTIKPALGPPISLA